jgi:predicted DCC family thiol-disulfide oxidoreductase YuxK
MRFAPLKGAFGAEVRRQHPETATVDSVIWYLPAEPGVARAYTRSDAALGVLGYLGGWWGLLAALGRAVPRPLRDAVYDAIARRRFTLVSRACLLPSAQQRHRFLT